MESLGLERLKTPAGWLEPRMVVIYFAVLLVLVLLMLFHLSVISKPLRQAAAASSSERMTGDYMGYGMVSQNGNSNGQVSSAGSTVRGSSQFTSSNQGSPDTQSLSDYAWVNPSAPGPGYQNQQIGASSSERLTGMRQDPVFFTVDPLLEAYQLSTMDNSNFDISQYNPSDLTPGEQQAATQGAINRAVAQALANQQAAPGSTPMTGPSGTGSVSAPASERLGNRYKKQVNTKGRFGAERLTNADYVTLAVQKGLVY